MEAGNSLKVSVDLEKMNKKTNQRYWTSKCEEILKGVCALLNSIGGTLHIEIENESVANFEDRLDSVLRATEQHLKQFMSSRWFRKLVKMPNIQNKQFVYEVTNSDKVFTIRCPLYLPTQKQVEEIKPYEAREKIKDMSEASTEVSEDHFSRINGFVYGKSISLTESDQIQFKCVSNAKAKNSKTTIADRIINKCNKLTPTLSAFANECGGHVLFGISNDGTVKGQELTPKDKREVEAKVTKVISKMIWLRNSIEKQKHWHIEFIPVIDDKNNEKESLFVIKISIEALPGGVLVQQPESYRIGSDKKVELMPFEDWKSRILNGVVPILSNISRIGWSSVSSQKNYFTIIFELNDLQNQAKYAEFTEVVTSLKEKYAGTTTELFIMIVESVVAYKRGMIKKANEIVTEIESELESQQNVDDRKILEFRILYARSAIARADHDYETSYEYAKEAQQIADQIQPGVLTAWFYNHVAIVEKFLYQEQERNNDEMQKSALNHYIKALQYAKASDVEQEFDRMIADLEQRIHIFRAISILGHVSSGANVKEITAANIEEASKDLQTYYALCYAGYPPSNYRRIYALLAECDVFFARWYQNLVNEKCQPQRAEGHPLQQEMYRTPVLLNEAHKKATEARELSKQHHFDELNRFANWRLGRIAEMLAKLNFAMTFSRRRNMDF